MKRILFILVAMVISIGCSEKREKVSINNINKIEIKSSVLKPNVIEKETSEIEKKQYQEAHDLWYNDRPEEAIKKLSSFINSHPNSSLADDAQNLIGNAYSNLKDFNKAIEEFKKVSLKYPKSNKASISLYDIAHCYFYNLYDYNNAKTYYQLFVQVATEEDRKWHDFAIEQLNDCEKES